jgi:isopenicillin N synthase-like dioxygenase
MSVPVIDLTAAESDLIGQIGDACERMGFFTIVNHGVPADVIEEAWSAARTFFDLPEAAKLRLRPGDREGLMPNLPQYYPVEEEALAAGLGVRTPGDLKESLGFGPADRGRPWPAQAPGLDVAMQSYFATMLARGERLRRLLMQALGQPADLLDALFPGDGGASYLRGDKLSGAVGRAARSDAGRRAHGLRLPDDSALPGLGRWASGARPRRRLGRRAGARRRLRDQHRRRDGRVE